VPYTAIYFYPYTCSAVLIGGVILARKVGAKYSTGRPNDFWSILAVNFYTNFIPELEGKYSLESTDPRESEIRAPSQPLPYLMPIPPNTLFITNSTY